MLTTSQALRHWDSAISLPAQIRVHAAVNPGQPMVEKLKDQLSTTLAALDTDLASPQATWKKLLRKKVPRKWLATCGDLIPVLPGHALTMAAMHLAQALITTSADKSSSGVQLAAELWEQVEQSSLLQHLPGLLSSSIATLQTSLTGEHGPLRSGQPADSCSEDSHDILSGVLFVLHAAQMLQPAYTSTQPARQQCLEPAMQLALMTLQHISKSMAQDGQQEWMQTLLHTAGEVGLAAAKAAAEPTDAGTDLHTGSASRSSSSHDHGASNTARPSTSTSNDVLDTAATSTVAAGCSPAAGSQEVITAPVAVVQAEQSVQWSCLAAFIPMLCQDVQQQQLDTDREPATAGSSTQQPRHTRQQPRSGRRRYQAGSETLAGMSRGQPGVPAVLAPSMPAAHNTVLEQLGCSKEVGLWLAQVLLTHKDSTRDQRRLYWLYSGCAAVLNYYQAVSVQSTHCLAGNALYPQLGTLHLSMSAAILQWLLGAPFDRLFNCIPTSTVDMLTGSLASIRTALQACELGNRLAKHHDRQGLLQDMQHAEQPDAMPQSASAAYHSMLATSNLSVAELAMRVLDKLLNFGRGLPNGGPSVALTVLGTGSSDTGTNSSIVTGSAVLQACQHIVLVFEVALREAALAHKSSGSMAHQFGVSQDAAGVLQLPVQPAVWCKLLQEYVRFSMSAVTAYPGSGAISQLQTTLLSLGMLFGGQFGQQFEVQLGLGAGGPLIASVVAAGGALSPNALQLFGLVCSLLKVYCSTAAAVGTVLSGGDGGGGVMPALYTSAVWLPVSGMLRAALAVPASSTGLAHTSSKCADALPWLMLLGRCCLACAWLVQQWDAVRAGDGPDIVSSDCHSSTDAASGGCSSSLASILHNLQSHLAFVAQWLASADTVQQLGALGYLPQNLQQQLSEASETLLSLSSNDGTDPTVLAAIQQQLLVAAGVLATFAIPHACNNSGCTNMSGPSEAQLVGGRTCICAGCRTARYCGRVCQRQAWRQHKPVCKALAAAAALVSHPLHALELEESDGGCGGLAC